MAFIEVIYDGEGSIKSYYYLAQRRKEGANPTWHKPTRNLKDKLFHFAGKCSEIPFRFCGSTPTTEEFRSLLEETAEDLKDWAGKSGWYLDLDDGLISCMDWSSYVRQLLPRDSEVIAGRRHDL